MQTATKMKTITTTIVVVACALLIRLSVLCELITGKKMPSRKAGDNFAFDESLFRSNVESVRWLVRCFAQ